MTSVLRNDDGTDVDRFEGLVGTHPLMLRLYDEIRSAASLRTPVIVEGATGTGKELVVQALHRRSRVRGRLIVINMAALPEHLAEAEVFGVVRGAFTGAVDRRGLFEEASGGTLYLDEASDAPLGLQAKLLRVLENGLVRRVGCHRDREVQVRVIVSTQTPAKKLVRDGRWREDFYYRVGGVNLVVPPLRSRPTDIVALVNHFIAVPAHPIPSHPLLDPLLRYHWPGNVRELRRLVERAVSETRGEPVAIRHLLSHLEAEPARVTDHAADVPDSDHSLRNVERRHFERVLRHYGGDTAQAAKALGMSRSGLYYRLSKLGVPTSVYLQQFRKPEMHS